LYIYKIIGRTQFLQKVKYSAGKSNVYKYLSTKYL